MQLRKKLAAGIAAVMGAAALMVPSGPATANASTTSHSYKTQAATETAAVVKAAEAKAAPAAKPNTEETEAQARAAMPKPPRVKDMKKGKSQQPKASWNSPRGKDGGLSKPGAPRGPTKSGVSTLLAGPYYHYATGYQYAEADGASANLGIQKPFLQPDDYHTLGEVAVQSADGLQKVEIGWVVSQNINGDLDPHIFGYHWVNGEATCWNTCGWVDNAAVSTNLGDAIPSSMWEPSVTNIKFKIQFYDGVWWLGFNGEWLGHYPKELWSDEGVTFEKGGLFQAFGEVLSTRQQPCTDMGNGVIGTNASALSINSFSLILPNPSTTASSLTLEMNPTANTPDKYNQQAWSGSVRSYDYGGPGWNSVGSGAGAIGSCAPATAGTCPDTLCLWREICPDNQSTTGCNLSWNTSATMPIGTCTVLPSDTYGRAGFKNTSTTGKAWRGFTNTGCTGTTYVPMGAGQGVFSSTYKGANLKAVKRIS